MEESERIQKIMEVEGATEPEARFLHHLYKVNEAWGEITEANSEKHMYKTAAAVRFIPHYKALQTMIFSEIHVRERPGSWDEE